MRRGPSSSRAAPCGGSSHSTRRPCRLEVSRPSDAVRVNACRADFSSTPSAASASSRVAVHTDSCRGCTNSPSTVSSSDRALAEPTSRRREADGAGSVTVPAFQVTRPVMSRLAPSRLDQPTKTGDSRQSIGGSSSKRRVLLSQPPPREVRMPEPQHDATDTPEVPVVDYETHPAGYRHWRLVVDGDVATLTLTVDENGGLVEGYQLKSNSYDLGVDIELYDAVQRLRFEHPQVKAVVMTGGLDRMFCAGANIRMLAQSSHAWKVNFCKFTNETRNGIEDATEASGQTWIAALNGTAAGGGYELALAWDDIVLIEDGASTVSLPGVALLGVLPGTGGLTRVVDKRHVRKDRADLFATKSEGYRGDTAVQWGLID